MKNTADKELLALLVRVYNHSIQSYFYFPEVIIYSNHRLEKEEFIRLLDEEFIDCFYTDSFGRLYRLNKKGEAFLYHYTAIKKKKSNSSFRAQITQGSFNFR